jgi:uncharacterized protein (DUF885 family)
MKKTASTAPFGAVATLLGAVATLAGSGARAQDAKFETVAAAYVEDLLAMNPELATSLGDHRYDARLDDYSAQGVRRNLDRERHYLDALAGVDATHLSTANSVDYRILQARIERSIYSLDVLREHEWNPLRYNVGSALYELMSRDFGPLPERLRNLAARLKAVPAVVAAAEANLRSPPKVHTETAISQNEGTINLIGAGLDALLMQAPAVKEEVEQARDVARTALQAYGEWLETDLLPRSDGDFRIGREKFKRKLAHVLDSDLTMEEILARAQRSLAAAQEAMYKTALPLYRDYVPNAEPERLADRKLVIRTVLDRLAADHPSDATIVAQARDSLAAATAFVREHALATVPEKPIRLIVMPEFDRGVAVAYCDSPGPLEKRGETFFAISPTPKDWTSERVDSFYREYNDYMLQDLTVHEAMPGHYLQIAHSNEFRAPTKIRAIFSSGAFVEGWAVYAEQLMAEQGYGGPEVEMQQLKMALRTSINAILDQKVHTAGMTEREAMDLMMNEGFQEEGEAAGKWRRAMLTSTQLSTYFVGYTEVVGIREAYEAKHGPTTDWRAFHDLLLSFGSPPTKYVKEMMGL